MYPGRILVPLLRHGDVSTDAGQAFDSVIDIYDKNFGQALQSLPVTTTKLE